MPLAKHFFTQQEQDLLLKAIAQAEMHTSGEIRLHLESFCLGSEVKAAQRVFNRLKMQQTAERNGVLIYIATMSRKVAIIGDKGIHEKLGEVFWNNEVKNLIQQFKQDKKAEGLADAINNCGLMLGRYFPRKDDDRNELSNDISF